MQDFSIGKRPTSTQMPQPMSLNVLANCTCAHFGYTFAKVDTNDNHIYKC